MMDQATRMTAKDIRSAKAQNTDLYPRNLAEKLNISEAELIAAETGHGAVRLEAHPDQLIAHVQNLGEVMALTRNDSCVIEKTGVYENYRGGPHATMVLNKQIDLRMFPKHWRYAYAVEQQTDKGPKRSIQIFDAAGDAVHKIYLRPASNLDEWEVLKTSLLHDQQSDLLDVAPRKPTDPARGTAEQAEQLRAEWDKMTDTHQFIRFVHKMKMNRLGAYRVIGSPYVRALEVTAVETAITELAGTGIETFTFAGNLGCIQIHHGVINTVKQVGPWFNILDPGYDLHLRTDHIAEVYAVTKSTRDGPTTSIEAFDADGMIILQMFGSRRSKEGDFTAFQKMVEAMPTRDVQAKENA